MIERTPFLEVGRIIDLLPDHEWEKISTSDASKDAFLTQHGWTIEEFKIELAKMFPK